MISRKSRTSLQALFDWQTGYSLSVFFSYATVVLLLCLAPRTCATRWSTECSKFCKCFSSMDPLNGSIRKIVDCSSGRFHVDLHLTFPSDLDTLNVSGNSLSSSRILTIVDNLVNIRSLNLSNNSMDNVRGFKRLRSRVSILDISKNGISSITGDWLLNRERLYTLNISYNKIEFIHPTALSYMGKLKHLDLSHNRIWQLHKAWFHDLLELETLNLSHNSITTLSSKVFQHLTSLATLDLSHNRMASIGLGAFVGISKLKILYLNENELSTSLSKPLERFHRLSVLDLSNNNFRQLSSHAFNNVKTQRLLLNNEKYLKYIQGEVFANMPFLERLDITKNPNLEYIDHRAFSNIPLISSLHLEDNKLRAVSNKSVGQLASLQELFIKGNPIVCDCNIHWLLLDTRATLVLVDLNDTVCHGPTLLSGRLLSQSLRWYVPSLCKPDIVSDFDEAYTFSFGDRLRFECYALGTPPPDVYWIFSKDTIPNFCSTNDTQRIHPIESGSTLSIEPMTFHNSGQYKCVARNTEGRTEKCFTVEVQGNDANIVILGKTDHNIVFTWNGTDSSKHYNILFRQTFINSSSDYQTIQIHPGMRKYIFSHLNSSSSFEICIALSSDRTYLDRKCVSVATTNEKMAHIGIYNVRSLVIGLSIGCSIALITCACIIRISIRKYNKSHNIGRYMLPQSTSRQRIVSEGRSSVGTPTTYENKMLELSDEECFIEESEASFSPMVT